jgi:ATP-dependent RNA helicase DDX35
MSKLMIFCPLFCLKGIDNVLNFPWLAPPSSEALVRSLESLHALGALGNDAKLTDYWGNYMAEFPLQPSLSKCLLTAWSNGCALEVATVVAILNVQSVWIPRDKKSMDQAKLQFAVGEGDLITYLNVWKAWEDSGRSKAWAIKNLVSYRCLLRALDIRDQILRQLVRIKQQTSAEDPVFGGRQIQELKESMLFGNANMFMDERQEKIKVISKSLLSGLFLNAVEICDEVSATGDLNGPSYRLLRNFGESQNETRLRIHPSSVLFRCRPKYLCFFAAQQVDTRLVDMQEVHSIEPEWLHEIAPHFFETVKKHTL